jgi:hypothetical protein
MELNHVANRLHLRHFETVVDMLKAKLDFVELSPNRAVYLAVAAGDERGPAIQPQRHHPP